MSLGVMVTRPFIIHAGLLLDKGVSTPSSYVQGGKTDGLNLNSGTTSRNDASGPIAKQEDAIMQDAIEPPKPSYFKIYGSADEISFTPEDALKEGVGMVKAIKNSLKQLQLGSKLRHEVWQREIEKYIHILSMPHSDVNTRIFFSQSARPRCSYDIDCCVRRSEGHLLVTSALLTSRYLSNRSRKIFYP